MGRKKRTIPKRLPEKLKAIRAGFACTLETMVIKLEAKLVELDYPNIKLYPGNIGEYEKGERDPLLPVLLAYARIAGVSIDHLVDDKLDLTAVADSQINREN